MMRSITIGVITTVLAAVTGWAGTFTAGNLAVEEVGNGSTLSSVATPVAIQEFTPTNTAQSPVQTIGLPQASTLPTANPFNLLESGSASSAGFITRSTDGTTLCIPGYNGTPAEDGIVGGAEKRVIGTLASAGTPDTSRGLTMYTGNNFRSVASVDGTAFWCAGPDGTAPMGLVYYDGAIVTALNAGYNARTVRIVNNTLYFSSGASSKPSVGVHQLGVSGVLPTSAATSTASAVALPPSPASTPAESISKPFLRRSST